MSGIARGWDSDVCSSFRRSPVALISALILIALLLGAVFCRWVAPDDLASLKLMDRFQPPAFMSGGGPAHLLGTGSQGRDLLSAILYGARISFAVGISAVLFAVVVGVAAGLLAGNVGGAIDTVLMRMADLQLSFPAFLIALLVDSVVSVSVPRGIRESLQIYILIFSIGISFWPQFARAVRDSTLIERGREYVMAARVIGLSAPRIMLTHILPNVLGPVMVIATFSLGLAIIFETTLSYLGIGVAPTQPSLGTLIRIGSGFLSTGEWWVTVFPGVVLLLIVLSINVLGDWLRGAMNPKLR